MLYPNTELDHIKLTFVKLCNWIVLLKNTITSRNNFFKADPPLSSMASMPLFIKQQSWTTPFNHQLHEPEMSLFNVPWGVDIGLQPNIDNSSTLTFQLLPPPFRGLPRTMALSSYTADVREVKTGVSLNSVLLKPNSFLICCWLN